MSENKPGADEQFCSSCGEVIKKEAEICPECGVSVGGGSGTGLGGTTGETNSGLDENAAGALAYILGLLSGLFFYVTEEENDFVRFHAMQSILFSVAAIIVNWVVSSLLFSIIFRGAFFGYGLWGLISLISTLVTLALGVVWLLLMFKAYNGERYKLPVIGDFAEENI
ncbi:MAG: DUF4870 domain-containing protein [Halobacteria archaeon]|nr:DUF4870 domain-containing protein [Halobacteria archaeon]